MKDRMERFVVFPFATGCISSSSVAVCVQHSRRPKEEINSSNMVCRSFDIPKDLKDLEGTSGDNMMKSSFRFLALSKPNVSVGLHKLTRSIKSLSQSLVFKDEMEHVQMEMEIGLPTDVKHVTHIGFDGSATPNVNHHDNKNASDFLSLCPISFAQLEEQLAMCAPMNAIDDMENMVPNTTYVRDQPKRV